MSTESNAPELAPSALQADEPVFARVVGLTGLGLAVLGIAAIIANQFSPRMVGLQGGIIFSFLGTVMLLFLALRDGEREIRRVFGATGTGLIVLGLLTLVIPAKSGELATWQVANLFLPYGAAALLAGVGFLAAFLKHETEEGLAEWGQVTLLVTGVLLLLASTILGTFWPMKLVGLGGVMALISLVYLWVYLAQADVSTGRGFQIARLVGIVGGVIMVIALVRSIAPTILFEGPGALRNARQELDSTAAFGRGFLILLSLAVAALARKKDLLPEVRIGLLTSGLLFALIFVLGCFNTNLFSTAPSAYLIPSGLIFAFLGFLTLMMAVLFLSDAQLVVLTRREFAAYLYSPIGYIVLIGTSLVAAYGYWSFLDQMIPSEATLAELQQLKREITIPEPILTRYNAAGIVAVFQVLFLVPALTMRTFSEEKRTGTLEMLLTAPILEWKIVVSKFLAAWAFYILSFAPIGLYLIALWVVGERPFDYRPMMSYYIAVAAYGASFLGIGLFLSSLTKNQIVAAVLMFAVMIGMLLTFWLRGSQSTLFGPGVRAILEQFDFLSTWYASLSGTLPVRTMMLQASLAAFWLFVTTKVLEIRKWG